MTFRVGDTLFLQNASPATVVGHDDLKSTVKYDRDYEAFKVSTRNGLVNGMAPETREEFNKILDEVKDGKTSEERVDAIRTKIEELKADPKNHNLIQYLDGEVRHLMNVKNVQPRFFTTEEFKVR
jgi:Cys-tRNA synthase (O-phospho-L-seryl-tRNA:Cys-tRNA synthase)